MKYFHSEKGLTLIELEVVMAVFLLIIGVAVTLFLSIVGNQRSVLYEQDFANQSGFLFDYVSRSARTAIKDLTGDCLQENQIEYPGYHYLLTRYDSVSGYYAGLKFLNNDNVCEEFFLDTDGILKEIQDTNAAQPILSSAFTIDHIRFVINGDSTIQGSSETDGVQPRVTMVLATHTQINGAIKNRIVQTTISQINLNIP